MEYIDVAMKLKDLGMQEIEKKRDQCLFNKQQAQNCTESEKLFIRIKANNDNS